MQQLASCHSDSQTVTISAESATDFGNTVQKHTGAGACLHVVRRTDLMAQLGASDWVPAAAPNFANFDPHTAGLLSMNHRKEYKLLAKAARDKDATAAWLTSEYATKHTLLNEWGARQGHEPVPSVAIFRDAHISAYGELSTAKFSLKLKSCKPKMSQYRSPPSSALVHDAVAVVAAPFYSEQQDYFHFMCERLVRVVLLIDLLRSQPSGWLGSTFLGKRN